jgi:Stress responsive A/B Barrel Domain
MIKHIVIWKLKDQAEGSDKAANAAKVKRLLDSCSDCVPGIAKFEVSLAGPGFECTYDVVLYSEFVDRRALDAYQEHPDHKAIKPFIGAVRESRQCMDYEAQVGEK